MARPIKVYSFCNSAIAATIIKDENGRKTITNVLVLYYYTIVATFNRIYTYIYILRSESCYTINGRRKREADFNL